MRTGKIKVIIDQAEHTGMDEIFATVNEYLGGMLEISRQTLKVGDYILQPEGEEPLIITFKEIKDFQQSFFNGHLMEEILAIHLEFPNSPKALIIARDENIRTPQDVHIWVDTHWQKRNFLIPTFKFGSRKKAVEFMVDCAMKIDTLQTIPRNVKRPEDLHQIVGLYSFYGVGVDKAKQLAERFPKPFDLFTAMKDFRDYKWAKQVWELNERTWAADFPEAWKECERKKLTKKVWKKGRWAYGILGETTALRIEEFILDGKEIPKKIRGE
jgi:hypothetical protein